MDHTFPYIVLTFTALLVKFQVFGIDPSIRADIYLKTPELITKNGYPAETHTVKTLDGHLINMHRIPFSPKSPAASGKPIIFIQHGLFASSADYVIGKADSALGFLLADLGYDVFIGNSRGNIYCMNHVNLTSKDKIFWDFSFHEMALYDLPAEIDYILQITNQEHLSYLGMSMGTSMFFALISEKPEYNEKIKFMIAMGPVVYVNTSSKSVIDSTKYLQPVLDLSRIMHEQVVFPPSDKKSWIAEHLCGEKFLAPQCSKLLVSDPAEQKFLNNTIIPVSMSHFTVGASWRTVNHFQQILKSGRFEKYDYGLQGNMLRYGQSNPPKYNMSRVLTKIAVVYSNNDGFNGPEGARMLCERVQNCLETYEVPRKTYMHMEFVLGIAIDVKELVYDKLIQLFNDN